MSIKSLQGRMIFGSRVGFLAELRFLILGLHTRTAVARNPCVSYSSLVWLTLTFWAVWVGLALTCGCSVRLNCDLPVPTVHGSDLLTSWPDLTAPKSLIRWPLTRRFISNSARPLDTEITHSKSYITTALEFKHDDQGKAIKKGWRERCTPPSYIHPT